MPASGRRADLRQIRLDDASIRQLPEQVQQAVEIITAYVAGVDRGLRAAGRSAPPVAAWPDEIPETAPDDTPLRDGLEARAAQRLAAEQQASSLLDDSITGGGIGICMVLSEVEVPGETAPEPPSGAPQIALLWGHDCYRQLTDLLK